jgi:dTDP-4-dehydrorhamnose 3,5-epimerase
VIRGLHFQKPQAAAARIAFTTQSRNRDVVIEFRIRSPTCGSVAQFELTDTRGTEVVPQRWAHGFEVLDGPALTCRLQDGPSEFATGAGVRWDSAEVVWRTADPVVSDRHDALPAMDRLQSPFSAAGPAHVG